MKKLISILLVAMLILGMFPATALTAFAADTYEKATNIAVGDTVVLVYEAGKQELSSISTTSTKYGIGVKYTDAPEGAMPLTVEQGSAAGTYAFKTSAGYYLYWTSGNSLNVNATKNANTSWTVTFDGSGNAVIANVGTSNRTIRWNTSSPRFACYTSGQAAVQLYKLNTSACDHANAISNDDAVAPTCTEPGWTDSYDCPDCGETIAAEPIDPQGHNYEDGFCTECGDPEPDGFSLVTSESQLEIGATIIIAAKESEKALGATQAGNNRPEVDFDKENDLLAPGDDVQLITLEEGNVAGTFAFKTDEGYLYAASSNSNYLRSQATNDANSSWAIEIAADGTATVKARGTNTRNWLRYNNTSKIFSCYSSGQKDIVIYMQSAGGEEPVACEHTNTEPIAAVPATCTTPGKTEGVKCSDCGEILTAQKETPVEPHSYTDGVCSVCGLYEIPAELMAELPGNGDKIIIYHPNTKNAMGAGDSDGDDKLDAVAAEAAEGLLPYNTSVAVLTVEFDGESYAFKLSDGTYLTSKATGNGMTFEAEASDLALWTIAAENDLWILTNVAAEYNGDEQALECYYNEFTTYGANTTAAYQMAFYLVEKGEEACQHENTTEQEDGYDADCTTPGKTNSWVCDDCGTTVTAQQEIPAPGHNYVDGFCTACSAAEPERYYIAAFRNSEQLYYYMTNDLGTASTKRYQAAATDMLPSNIPTADADEAYMFEVVDNGDDIYSIKTGEQYLGWTSANSGTLVDEESALKLSKAENEDGTVSFFFQPDSGDARYLSLNTNKTSNYFAWYAGTQIQNLYLIPVEDTEDRTVILCSDVDSITCEGDLTLDLNGHKATNVTVGEGKKIYACDSSATVTKAGDGVLTTTAEVEVDNTVNGVRYIALEGEENTYTFHVLQLKLTNVSLRPTAAGLYYKAELKCDTVLKKAVDSYGVVLSVHNMPGKDFETEESEQNEINRWSYVKNEVEEGDETPFSGMLTSVSVFGIFKEDEPGNADRGEMEIYANAYIKLKGEEGKTIMADIANVDQKAGVAMSMRKVMEALDGMLDRYNETQRASIVAFYEQWADAMDGWKLPTLNPAQ